MFFIRPADEPAADVLRVAPDRATELPPSLRSMTPAIVAYRGMTDALPRLLAERDQPRMNPHHTACPLRAWGDVGAADRGSFASALARHPPALRAPPPHCREAFEHAAPSATDCRYATPKHPPPPPGPQALLGKLLLVDRHHILRIVNAYRPAPLSSASVETGPSGGDDASCWRRWMHTALRRTSGESLTW